MASRQRSSTAEENALNAAQGVFTANPTFLAPPTKHFLQAQERILDEVEKFSAAWMQRRDEATRSMIAAGRRMVSKGQVDPASALQEIVAWQTQSMKRLAEDAQDGTEMLKSCAGALVDQEVKAVEEISETVKQATSTSTSEPV